MTLLNHLRLLSKQNPHLLGVFDDERMTPVFYKIYDHFGRAYVSGTTSDIYAYFKNKKEDVKTMQTRLEKITYLIDRPFNMPLSPHQVDTDFDTDVTKLRNQSISLYNFCYKYGYTAEPLPLSNDLINNYIKNYAASYSNDTDPLFGTSKRSVYFLKEESRWQEPLIETQQEALKRLNAEEGTSERTKYVSELPEDVYLVQGQKDLYTIYPPNEYERQAFFHQRAIYQIPDELLDQMIYSLYAIDDGVGITLSYKDHDFDIGIDLSEITGYDDYGHHFKEYQTNTAPEIDDIRHNAAYVNAMLELYERYRDRERVDFFVNPGKKDWEKSLGRKIEE